MVSVSIVDAIGDLKYWRDWHVLTVAETGFSALMAYACNGQYRQNQDSELVLRFVNQVNDRNESGSLHPQEPISALPRRYFRDIPTDEIPDYIDDFKQEIRSFISANRRKICAEKILVDFHVSPDGVSQYYIEATEKLFSEAIEAGQLLSVVIVKGIK